MQTPVPRPVQFLTELTQAFPKLSHDIDGILARMHARGIEWPSYCFMPLATWYHIAHGLVPNDDMECLRLSVQLGCAASWRYTQSIYRFDKDLLDAIYDTELDGVIPLSVLLHLPEWCVYIELPDLSDPSFEGKLHGMWAMIDYDPSTGRSSIVMLLDCENAPFPCQITLDENATLNEAWERVLHTYENLITDPSKKLTADKTAEIHQTMLMAWKVALPPLLYLCSQEPDIIDRKEPDWIPRPPKPKKVKGGFRLFPAQHPRFVDVGSEIGKQLRAASATHTAGDGTRTVRSHLRRAHWHSFWTGPRKNPKPGEQKIVLRWLSPILVRGRDERTEDDA